MRVTGSAAEGAYVHLWCKDGARLQEIADSLEATGWIVSASSELPSRLHRLCCVIIHQPSVGAELEPALRTIASIEGVGPAVFIWAPDAPADARCRWIEAGAVNVIDGTSRPRELLAKMWWAARRRRASVASARIVANLLLDSAGRRLHVHGREIHLTPSEVGIIELLMARRGEPVSHDEIRRAVLGVEDRIETSKVRNHIRNLRKKLGRDASLIETVGPHQQRLNVPPVRRAPAGERASEDETAVPDSSAPEGASSDQHREEAMSPVDAGDDPGPSSTDAVPHSTEMARALRHSSVVPTMTSSTASDAPGRRPSEPAKRISERLAPLTASPAKKKN